MGQFTAANLVFSLTMQPHSLQTPSALFSLSQLWQTFNLSSIVSELAIVGSLEILPTESAKDWKKFILQHFSSSLMVVTLGKIT